MSTAGLNVQTVGDLIERLGGIPAHRIRLVPTPGNATEGDLIAIRERDKRLYELVDGVLVEKALGYYESYLAILIVHFLMEFLEQKDLGIVAGADGMLRLAPGCVRIPDVSFISWARLPGRVVPRDPIPNLVPDLAVEVLSAGNTAEEMDGKLREYFQAGVRLVWYVAPEARTVTVYSSPTEFRVVGEDGTLDGGEVLSGFALPLQRLFGWAERGR